MDKNFTDFTQESSPNTGVWLVGIQTGESEEIKVLLKDLLQKFKLELNLSGLNLLQIPALAGFPSVASGASIQLNANEDCGLDFDSVFNSFAYYRVQIPLTANSSGSFIPKIRVKSSSISMPNQEINFTISAKKDDETVYSSNVQMGTLITGGSDYATLIGDPVFPEDVTNLDWLNIKIFRNVENENPPADGKVTLTEMELNFN